MTITDSPVDNGVNTAALLGAREALTAQPEAAEFTWRATCSWVHGTHSTSIVDGFTGLGQDMHHRTTYRFEVDHPECFASQDLGATPVEYVLVGLAGCLTAGVAAVAQHRQIQLRSVTATIEGDDERARHPRRRPRRPQRVRRRSRPVRRSTPTPPAPRSRRSSPSRRSGRPCSTSSPTPPTSTVHGRLIG